MSDLNNVVRKIKEQRSSNSQYKCNGQVVEQRRTELANRLTLDEATLTAAAIFLQYTDLTRFTDEELIVIAESSLQDLQYSGEVTQIERILDPNNPSFDIDGVVLNDNVDYTNLRKSYKRALASHKSHTSSFQSTFLSNI